MITRVQVKNFRSIASADVSLGPLTVLVGRNGAGKSAFVDVLSFVRDALQHNLDYAFSKRNGMMSLRRWSPNKFYELEVYLTVDMGLYGVADYGFTIESTRSENKGQVKREFFQIVGGAYENSSYEVRDGKWEHAGAFLQNWNVNTSPLQTENLLLPFLAISAFPEFRVLLDAINGSTYSLFPNTLREPQAISNEKRLAENGANFASALHDVQEGGEFIADLRLALRRVADGVQDVRTQQLGGYLLVELCHSDLTKLGSGNQKPWFDLVQESDGTVRMLALLTALYQQNPPPFLALEEPEISLHPGALAVLADVIKEASLRQQVIITTQSPDLISHFKPNELRVVERVDGATEIGPLDTRQRKAIVEKLFSAGDLLRVEGLHREPAEPDVESGSDA